MGATATLIRVRNPAIRVPIWSLWFPLYLLPDFILHMCWWSVVERTLAPLRRLRKAECWSNMFAFYLVGLDGWDED